jgi:hypothetical protein
VPGCTAVISKVEPPRPKEAEFEEKLAEKLAARGADVVLVPDVYHLPADEDCLADLRALEGPLLVFGWRKPRATFWTLRAAGVVGARSEDLSGDGRHERPVVCFDLHDRCCPERWMEKVAELLGPGSGEGPGSLVRLERDARLSAVQHRAARSAAPGTARAGERWYPVLDYSRCTDCGECLEFCLFGVYEEAGDGRVVASDPDSCKPGCPACSRVCPAQAIMFPLCEEDPVIAGSDEGTITPFEPATLERVKDARSRGAQGLAEIARACGCNRPGGGGRGPRPPGAEVKDTLDELLDGAVGG